MVYKKELKKFDLELFEDTLPQNSLTESVHWEISEADESTGIVDGVSILGRAVGPFFVVDGKSQNNRFYERSLWERVIKEGQETIRKGQMLGTMGHGQPLDDSALLEGKVSHRVSKLWIDETKRLGMGEVLILNTPAGRTLNAYLRGGVEFPVSSRGYGKYSGQMEDGTRIVDSSSYKLEGFDFVRVPGVPTAIPRLVEADEEEDDEKDTKGKKESDNKEKSLPPFLKKNNSKDDEDEEENDDEKDKKSKVKGDKDDEKEDDNDDEKDESRKSSRRVVSERKSSEEGKKQGSPLVEQRKVYKMEDTVLTKMTEEKIRLEENLRQALDTNSRLQETISALKGQNEEMLTSLNAYRQLGAVEEISRVMDVTETMLHNRPVEEGDFAALRETLEIYEDLGTPEELSELFDKFETFMAQYEELGTPADVDKALGTSAALLEGYSELGSPTDINEAFDSVETFMGEMAELGTVAELHAICDLLEAYQEFGTPAELGKTFEMMNALVDNTATAHLKAEGKAMAQEYGIDVTVAENMISAMGSGRAREALGAINESRGVTARYVAPRGRTNNSANESGSLNESAGTTVTQRTILNNTPNSRGQRLIEKMSR